MSNKPANIETHVGKKYLRTIFSPVDGKSIRVDIYAVLEAFNVTCPARQHAIKKLLCAGLRNKGSQMQDLEEAINASGPRILEMQAMRELNDCMKKEGPIETESFPSVEKWIIRTKQINSDKFLYYQDYNVWVADPQNAKWFLYKEDAESAECPTPKNCHAKVKIIELPLALAKPKDDGYWIIRIPCKTFNGSDYFMFYTGNTGKSWIISFDLKRIKQFESEEEAMGFKMMFQPTRVNNT